MTALQTTVHVGPDGILRLEVPVEERDRDVTVTITVSEPQITSETSAAGAVDPWAPYRARLEAAGLRVPPPGSWNARRIPLLKFDGPPVSQTLVEDRR